MTQWNEQEQRWRMSRKGRPIRYCFVDPTPGQDHPRSAWSEAEKAVGRAAIDQWNRHLKQILRKTEGDPEAVAETEEAESCDITLRWEDERFFKDWRQRDDEGQLTGIGDDNSGASGWGDRRGIGSTRAVEGKPGTPWHPGRDLTKFPEGEIYLRTELPRPPLISEEEYGGWFVDPTPGDDSEFESVPGDEVENSDIEFLKARRGGAADNAIDFYTVVKHEFGHMLGLDHRGTAGTQSDRGQVMADGVGGEERRHAPQVEQCVSERRHVTAFDHEALEASIIQEPDTLIEAIVFAIRWLLRAILRLFLRNPD